MVANIKRVSRESRDTSTEVSRRPTTSTFPASELKPMVFAWPIPRSRCTSIRICARALGSCRANSLLFY